jgi:hypothetical protein
MAGKLILIKSDSSAEKAKTADEHSAREKAAKRAHFDWADAVLKGCGLDEAVKLAKTREDLDGITLDPDDPDVVIAIRDALHPIGRQPDACFVGLKADQLKRLLVSRLNELKKPKLKKIIDAQTKRETAYDRKQGVKYYGDSYKVANQGVFWLREPTQQEALLAVFLGIDLDALREWVRITRTRIDLLATTRSITDDDWGVLVELTNKDGRRKRLAISASIITDKSGNIAGQLQSLGVDVVGDQRMHLPGFLLTNVRTRITAVPTIGWWQLKGDDHWAFVLPDQSFLPPGFEGEDVVLQTAHLHQQYGFAVAGSVQEWREQIARPFAGNSNVMLAVGQAFAGPLTNWAAVPPGFFHIVATSKWGKSLCSAIGQSVYGPPFTPRASGPDPFGASWDQTSNSLEQFAVTRSHVGGFIEEIGQGDHKAIAKAIYTIANGIVRGRLRSDLSQRPRHLFVVPGFSSGEETMVDFLRRAGMKVTEGMQTRLADVPAAIVEGTVFDTFNADALPGLGKKFYPLLGHLHGAVGRAWLRVLVDMQPNEIRDRAHSHQREWLNRPEVQARYLPAAQHERSVIDRFATVAAALRLAIAAGLLPWGNEDTDAGVAACMLRWAQALKLDPVVVGILRLMAQQPQWEGTATELLARGADIRDWPKAPETLGLRLKDGQTRQQLANSGITIEHGRTQDRKRRWIRISRIEG